MLGDRYEGHLRAILKGVQCISPTCTPMEIQCGKDEMTQIYFMLTNIVEENTTLLFYGDGSCDLIEDAFEIEPEEDSVVIDGLVSRKKQLIPLFMSSLLENE